MSEVYMQKREGERYFWKPLEEDIITCLEDPFKQGLYYMRDERISGLEMITKDNLPEHAFDDKSFIVFASNLGFSMDFSFKSRIKSPHTKEAYTLIQLSDKLMVDPYELGTLGKATIGGTYLIPNMMKIMDTGTYFIFDGTFKEVKDGIKEKGYRFSKRNEGEMSSTWASRIQDEVNEQRKRLITDKFVEKVNQEYFSGTKIKLTRDELLKKLSRFTPT